LGKCLLEIDLEKEYNAGDRTEKSMAEEINSLHSQILSEFERRIENDEDVPDAVVSALQEEEDLGLESVEAVNNAVKTGITDETE
jgi:hypothetical protein